MKRNGIIVIGMILLSSLCYCKPKIKAPKGWKLVWNDEFSGKKLDRSKWDFQIGTGAQYGLSGWGNEELEYYTEDNISFEKGMLVIEARKEEKNGKPYTSSRIRTYKDDGTVLFATTYGRIEARMKLPKGDGIWPAFWMLPASDKYGVWASSGEIDIMEAKGRLTNRVYGTLHYGQPWPGNKYSNQMYKFPEDTNAEDFHVYSLEWEPGVMRWLVDDNVYFETSSWWAMGLEDEAPFAYPAPYDEPFYILFNLAVGGTYDDFRKPSDSEVPAKMYVDWVRVFEKEDGYNYDVKKPVPPQDTKAFEAFRRNSEDPENFICDSLFETAELTGMMENTMDKDSGNWYFLTLSDFGGKASATKEDGAFHISYERAGNEVHSVQLIQHHGIAKGYTYQISFDAKASSDRTMAVKLGGDDDNKWVVYSSQYAPKLTTEYNTYKYRFTMEDETDKQARLEFNVGTNSSDVWIKNVRVVRVED